MRAIFSYPAASSETFAVTAVAIVAGAWMLGRSVGERLDPAESSAPSASRTAEDMAHAAGPRASTTADPAAKPTLLQGLGFLEALDTMSADEIPSQIRGLEGAFADEAQRRRILLLVGRWAALDPHSAVAYALSEGPEQMRGALVLAALTGWSSTDPDGAYSWYRARTEDLEFPTNSVSLRPILAVTAQNWARLAPEAAVIALADAPLGEAFHIWRGVGQAASDDAGMRPRILNAILALRDETAKAAALEHVLTVWKSHDPEGAARWAAEAQGDQD